jgi:hypothetical protein
VGSKKGQIKKTIKKKNKNKIKTIKKTTNNKNKRK